MRNNNSKKVNIISIVIFSIGFIFSILVNGEISIKLLFLIGVIMMTLDLYIKVKNIYIYIFLMYTYIHNGTGLMISSKIVIVVLIIGVSIDIFKHFKGTNIDNKDLNSKSREKLARFALKLEKENMPRDKRKKN